MLRLIYTQLGVFTLWHQRRAYERSRGEMITMLYEKTLNRKILGAKQDLASQINGEYNDPDRQTNSSNSFPQANKEQHGWFRRRLFGLFSQIRSVFTRREAEKQRENEPASMGKILNLMRNDVYEIAQRFWEFSDITTKPNEQAIFRTGATSICMSFLKRNCARAVN